jgi:hypothetical protein
MWEWLKVNHLAPLASRPVPTLENPTFEKKRATYQNWNPIVSIVIGSASPTCPTKPGSLAGFFLKIGISRLLGMGGVLSRLLRLVRHHRPPAKTRNPHLPITTQVTGKRHQQPFLAGKDFVDIADFAELYLEGFGELAVPSESRKSAQGGSDT